MELQCHPSGKVVQAVSYVVEYNLTVGLDFIRREVLAAYEAHLLGRLRLKLNRILFLTFMMVGTPESPEPSSKTCFSSTFNVQRFSSARVQPELGSKSGY